MTAAVFCRIPNLASSSCLGRSIPIGISAAIVFECAAIVSSAQLLSCYF